MSSIKLTSDTLAVSPAGGELEYNGQFFGTDSNNSRAQLERLVLETAKSATGTSVDFTGIPSWVKRITVMFNGVSTSGTSPILVQLGDSGGIEITGYVATSTLCLPTNTVTGVAYTAGFGIQYASATDFRTGVMIIGNINSSIWIANGSFTNNGSTGNAIVNGSKTLSATLDRIRITTVNGTDAFDAGTINILYEG